MSEIINALVSLLTIAILGRVILDWLIVARIMQHDSPIRYALIRITEPILGPIRRYARIGMIDMSPMVAIFILVIIKNAVMAAGI
jgi:uncharacterized protein YggT (Ycf19 family)